MANPNPNPEYQFKKGDPRTIAAAKKSKRKPRSERLLEKAMKEVKPGQTVDDVIEQTLIDLAKKGERWAMEMYFDRVDGKPKQITDSNIDINQPIIIQVPKGMEDV